MTTNARTEALLTSMGEMIRTRRLALGLTLRDIQEKTGLSHPFLSKIERGISQPSMRTLTSIADVLGTTAHALVALDVTEEVGDVRTGHSVEVIHGSGTARALVRGSWPFVPVEFTSGPREFEEFYVHPGREMMYVASGRCQMDVEGHGIYDLSEGESIFYGANVRHRWRQVSTGAVRILLIQENIDGGGHKAPPPR